MKVRDERDPAYLQLLPFFLPSWDTVQGRLVICVGWLHWNYVIYFNEP